MWGLEYKKVHQGSCLLEEDTWRTFLIFLIGVKFTLMAIVDVHLSQGFQKCNISGGWCGKSPSRLLSPWRRCFEDFPVLPDHPDWDQEDLNGKLFSFCPMESKMVTHVGGFNVKSPSRHKSPLKTHLEDIPDLPDHPDWVK